MKFTDWLMWHWGKVSYNKIRKKSLCIISCETRVKYTDLVVSWIIQLEEDSVRVYDSILVVPSWMWVVSYDSLFFRVNSADNTKWRDQISQGWDSKRQQWTSVFMCKRGCNSGLDSGYIVEGMVWDKPGNDSGCCSELGGLIEYIL